MPATSKKPANRTRKKTLPPAGPRKRDPKQLEKILDNAIEDSMATSDPASTVMPEVRKTPTGNTDS